jgi:hypothetical protein
MIWKKIILSIIKTSADEITKPLENLFKSVTGKDFWNRRKGDGSIFSQNGFRLYYKLPPKGIKTSPGLVIMTKLDPTQKNRTVPILNLKFLNITERKHLALIKH